MNRQPNSFNEKVLNAFRNFESIIALLVSFVIGIIIIVALFRIIEELYQLFVEDFFKIAEITFADYQVLFGKIMTLLISLEFMSSILDMLRSHVIKRLVQDVVLIAALAIARKLIIYDYSHHDPFQTLSLGAVLVAIGIFYYLIKPDKEKLRN